MVKSLLVISENISGHPIAALPIATPSASVNLIISSKSSLDLQSPLAKTGIFTAFLTIFIVS